MANKRITPTGQCGISFVGIMQDSSIKMVLTHCFGVTQIVYVDRGVRKKDLLGPLTYLRAALVIRYYPYHWLPFFCSHSGRELKKFRRNIARKFKTIQDATKSDYFKSFNHFKPADHCKLLGR